MVAVSSPLPYTVIQRVGTTGDIPISGTCGYHTTELEASFNGGAYQTIATAEDGAFSGVLSGQAQGQGTLVVRSVTARAATAQSIAYVGIGDIFSVLGQSNAVGLTGNLQQYSHPTLKACCFDRVTLTWGEYTTSANSAGSVWPLVASLHMAATGVPVGFSNSAVNSTSVTHWQPDQASYTNMLARIEALGGSIRAGLYWQGERDSGDAMSRNDYATNLSAIADDFGPRYDVPLIVANMGNEALSTAANIDAIRLAQLDVWESEPVNVAPGPSLYDVLLAHDGTHFYDDADLATAAARWWAAINAGVFGGSGGRGPSLSSATHNAGKTIVTLTFTGDTLPLADSTLNTAAFTVKSDGTPVTLSSAVKTGAATINITLASAASGTLTVSLGAGKTAHGLVVPTGGSAPYLPAEIFVDIATTLV